jgi:adenosylcobinamide hydrolase
VARVLLTSERSHRRAGVTRPLILWRPGSPVLAVASTVVGGGLGPRRWAVNATVDEDYDHPSPTDHLHELAAASGLDGDGIGFLTAVDVRRACWAEAAGAEVLATVGLGWPTWAAVPAEPDPPPSPASGAGRAGTVNLLVWVPARLADGALVNAIATATEAKAQALGELHVPGTGTASDAIAVCCPLDGAVEPYGGPRSTWGGRLARAVHAAVTAGARAEAVTEDHAWRDPA